MILQMDLVSIIVRMLKTTEPLVPLYDGLVLIGMPHYGRLSFLPSSRYH